MSSFEDGRIKEYMEKGESGQKAASLRGRTTLAVLLILAASAAAALFFYRAHMLEVESESISSMKLDATYSSRHGFSITYPAGWRLENHDLESAPSLAEAEKTGANHFDIYSYPAENRYNPGDPVPSNELKVEAIVYSDITESKADWGTSFRNIVRSEDMTIGGKPAKMIVQRWGTYYESLSVIISDGSRGVILNCWPSDSRYAKVFEKIANSFRFLR